MKNTRNESFVELSIGIQGHNWINDEIEIDFDAIPALLVFCIMAVFAA